MYSEEATFKALQPHFGDVIARQAIRTCNEYPSNTTPYMVANVLKLNGWETAMHVASSQALAAAAGPHVPAADLQQTSEYVHHPNCYREACLFK